MGSGRNGLPLTLIATVFYSTIKRRVTGNKCNPSKGDSSCCPVIDARSAQGAWIHENSTFRKSPFYVFFEFCPAFGFEIRLFRFENLISFAFLLMFDCAGDLESTHHLLPFLPPPSFIMASYQVDGERTSSLSSKRKAGEEETTQVIRDKMTELMAAKKDGKKLKDNKKFQGLMSDIILAFTELKSDNRYAQMENESKKNDVCYLIICACLPFI